jgi:signal peptide peptidase-like protein 2B
MGGVANGSTNSSSGGGSNGTQPAARNASDPAAISLLHDDGVALLGELRAGGRLTLQWQLLDVPALDASALLLWLLAVGTVAGGALWCGSDYAAELKGWPPSPEDGGWQQQQHSSSGGSSSHHTGGGGLEVLEITTVGACGFVAVSSGMLLLLYFFMSKVLLWVILFGFAAAGAQALTLLLLPAALAAAPRLAARSVVLPAWCGRCGGGGSDGGGLEIGLAELLVAPLAVATAVVWAVCRNASWSWALQDLLGVAIMLLVLRTLRLPNLRVACVLLPLCFAYDVFWVFLQPLLSGSGSSSVMVEVASGAGSSEFLPMLLRVPRLSGPPIIRGAYSLLGALSVKDGGAVVAGLRWGRMEGSKARPFV